MLESVIMIENSINKKNTKDIEAIEVVSPIAYLDFPDFKNNKEIILDDINKSILFNHDWNEDMSTKIEKTDFSYKEDFNRSWVKKIEEPLIESLIPVTIEFGFQGFKIGSIWFQQYNNQDRHGWHIHQFCNYSAVFYLEMPDDGPRTEFVDPWTKNIFSLKMKEGEIAIFPSYLPHRSPENFSMKKKTIISFNFNFFI